jgi:hypothetical protein
LEALGFNKLVDNFAASAASWWFWKWPPNMQQHALRLRAYVEAVWSGRPKWVSGMNEEGSQPVPAESVDAECRRLREENARLRQILAKHNISISLVEPADRPRIKSPEALSPKERKERAQKRIALFRSFFRGREDVYARRWESPDGRSGYSPASEKDWKAINRSRPEDRKKSIRRRGSFTRWPTPWLRIISWTETIGVYTIDRQDPTVTDLSEPSTGA